MQLTSISTPPVPEGSWMKKIEPVDYWGPIKHEHLITYEQKNNINCKNISITILIYYLSILFMNVE